MRDTDSVKSQRRKGGHPVPSDTKSRDRMEALEHADWIFDKQERDRRRRGPSIEAAKLLAKNR